MDNNKLTYKDFHATLKNNVLNVYNSENSLIHAKTYSAIVDMVDIERHFHRIADNYKKIEE